MSETNLIATRFRNLVYIHTHVSSGLCRSVLVCLFSLFLFISHVSSCGTLDRDFWFNDIKRPVANFPPTAVGRATRKVASYILRAAFANPLYLPLIFTLYLSLSLGAYVYPCTCLRLCRRWAENVQAASVAAADRVPPLAFPAS